MLEYTHTHTLRVSTVIAVYIFSKQSPVFPVFADFINSIVTSFANNIYVHLWFSLNLSSLFIDSVSDEILH